MYLNLDLLYNIDKYLFPLFYYKGELYKLVYSPMTNKSAYFYNNDFCVYFNYYLKKDYTITKDIIYYKDLLLYNKCKPFKINKKHLKFLENFISIN